MSDTAKSFLETLFACIAPVIGFCWPFFWLIFVPFPFNVAVAGAPFFIALYFFRKQIQRFLKIGYANECVREISQERVDKALEELAKTRKL